MEGRPNLRNIRPANSEEQEIIDLFKKSLSRLACVGIEALVNGAVTSPASPASPANPARPSDDGIYVTGDNINESYIRDYLRTSGIDDLSQSAQDEIAEENERACVLCEEYKSIMLFMPCMHNACCKKCASLLSECPLCRTEIDVKVRVFN